MTVYAVQEIAEYEGWDILSLHLTREGAEAKLAELYITDPIQAYGVSRSIQEYEVHP